MRPIGYWFGHLHGRLESTMTTVLAAQGLTRRHWQALNAIESGAASRADVDEMLGPFVALDGHPTTGVVDDLVARGWARADDPLVLTDAGRDGTAALRERIHAFRAEVMAGISAADQLAAFRVLERMAANLDTMTSAGGPST